MSKPYESGSTGFIDEEDEDTLELELTPEQSQRLANDFAIAVATPVPGMAKPAPFAAEPVSLATVTAANPEDPNAITAETAVLPAELIGVAEKASPAPEESVPIAVKAAPLPAEPAPIALKAVPLPAEPAPIAVKAAPLPAEPAPIAVKAAPLPAESAPIAVKAAPLPAEPAPIAVKAAPLPAEPAVLAAKAAPLPAEIVVPAAKPWPLPTKPAAPAAKAAPVGGAAIPPPIKSVPPAGTASPAPKALPKVVSKRADRLDPRATAASDTWLALLVGTVAIAILVGVIAFLAKPQVRHATATVDIAPISVTTRKLELPPTPPPVAPGEPLRYPNPFDAREVFEFPPGTSRTEARDAVSDILLKRALERRNPSAATPGPQNKPERPNTPPVPTSFAGRS